MPNAAGLEAAVAAADAEVRHHKREARRHRLSAQQAADRRDRFKARLASFGIGLIAAD